MTLNIYTKFKLSENQLSSNISNEAIILNHKDGIYYGLNEVGTFIWDKLKEKPHTIAELKTEVLAEYEIEEDICEKDINAILEELINEKLVETL